MFGAGVQSFLIGFNRRRLRGYQAVLACLAEHEDWPGADGQATAAPVVGRRTTKGDYVFRPPTQGPARRLRRRRAWWRQATANSVRAGAVSAVGVTLRKAVVDVGKRSLLGLLLSAR